MSEKQTPAQLSIKLLGPLVAEVSDWLSGKEGRRPKVLALLPNELQSEIALKRLEARRAAGLEPPEEKPAAAQPAIALPAQVSSLSVTTGAAPEPAS